MLTLLFIILLVVAVGVLSAWGMLYEMRKSIPASNKDAVPALPSGFKCPYCRVDVVGIRDLDLINHSLCITRSEEELDKMRAEAKAEAKNVKPEDVYFVDTRCYSYSSYYNVPDKWTSVAYYSDGQHHVCEGKIYRNGDLFKTVYGKGTKVTNEFAQREITIDKHKRQLTN